MKKTNRKILLVVAHPDDETIWFGGTLHNLSKYQNTDVHVVCLWGILERPGTMSAVTPGWNDFSKAVHFYEVCKNLKFNSSTVVVNRSEHVDARAEQSDENILSAFTDGLKEIGKDLTDFDLIITHSPGGYGEEGQHAHHRRLYNFFRSMYDVGSLPFGFFSFPQISALHTTKVIDGLTLAPDFKIDYVGRCDENNLGVEYFVLFDNRSGKKLESFMMYKSIDFNKHFNQYEALRSSKEYVYLNSLGYEALSEIFQDKMEQK